MIVLFRPAFSLLLVLSALTGVVYPLAVTGIAQALFPNAANGVPAKIDCATIV